MLNCLQQFIPMTRICDMIKSEEETAPAENADALRASLSTLRQTEERWGIKACNEMDQIFVQDLFHIVMQIRAVDTVDVVIQLERMNDVEYCCNMLQQLTGVYHEPSVVDLFIHNPVNRRT